MRTNKNTEIAQGFRLNVFFSVTQPTRPFGHSCRGP